MLPMEQLTPLILLGLRVFGGFGFISLLSSNMNLNNTRAARSATGSTEPPVSPRSRKSGAH